MAAETPGTAFSARSARARSGDAIIRGNINLLGAGSDLTIQSDSWTYWEGTANVTGNPKVIYDPKVLGAAVNTGKAAKLQGSWRDW